MTPLLEFRRRSFLTSKGENAFYLVLQEAVGAHYGISMKVRLADLVEPTAKAGSLAATWAFRRISQKHIDFVLYDPRSTLVRLAIELDDASHERRARRRRDLYVDTVLESAGIPLLRCRASSEYNTRDLQEEINRMTQNDVTTKPKTMLRRTISASNRRS